MSEESRCGVSKRDVPCANPGCFSTVSRSTTYKNLGKSLGKSPSLTRADSRSLDAVLSPTSLLTSDVITQIDPSECQNGLIDFGQAATSECAYLHGTILLKILEGVCSHLRCSEKHVQNIAAIGTSNLNTLSIRLRGNLQRYLSESVTITCAGPLGWTPLRSQPSDRQCDRPAVSLRVVLLFSLRLSLLDFFDHTTVHMVNFQFMSRALRTASASGCIREPPTH